MRTNAEQNNRNVFYQPGDEPVFCYRSGLTVYEESFTGGTLLARGWNTAGYPLNVLSNCATRINTNLFSEPQAFKLELDGEYADWELIFKDFVSFEEGEALHAVVTLFCETKETLIKVHTLLDGTPVFSRWLELVNQGKKAVAISKLAVISGGIETMGNLERISCGQPLNQFYRLGYFDAHGWGREGDFDWHDLEPDVTSFSGRYQRERYRHPIFYLQNRLKGTIMVGQMAWSGGYRFSFDYMAHETENITALSYEMEVNSIKPILVLGAGESWFSPSVHIGMVQGDLDDACNAMHQHTRKSILNLKEAVNPVMVGAGMGAEHDMNVDTTKQFMEQMARAGAEVFIVDAGWYCPPTKEMQWGPYAGEWYYNQERYPNGIREIEDYCRSLGMKFGLWMEAERIGDRSKAFKEHPDWFCRYADNRTIPGYLDLTNSEAAAWAENEAARVIEEYHLDLFRVDYNVEARTMFHVGEKDGRKTCRSSEQVNAFYTMYERLKKRFPNVVFENCAGGGGRTDLGMLRQFNHSWVSDCQVAPRSVLITNGMSMAIPPDRVDRLVAGMGCHEYGSLDLHMRNAMLGHISLNVFGPRDAEMNPEVFCFIRHSVELYKSFIKPYIKDALIYHHTPDKKSIAEKKTVIIELASADRTRDTVAVFTMPGYQGEPICVMPKGLEPEGVYRVEFDNSGASSELLGYELITKGITVRVNAALSSELVLLKKIDN